MRLCPRRNDSIGSGWNGPPARQPPDSRPCPVERHGCVFGVSVRTFWRAESFSSPLRPSMTTLRLHFAPPTSHFGALRHSWGRFVFIRAARRSFHGVVSLFQPTRSSFVPVESQIRTSRVPPRSPCIAATAIAAAETNRTPWKSSLPSPSGQTSPGQRPEIDRHQEFPSLKGRHSSVRNCRFTDGEAKLR